MLVSPHTRAVCSILFIQDDALKLELFLLTFLGPDLQNILRKT